MSEQKLQGQEKRRYVRIDGYFPVDFTVVRLQDDLLDLPWSTGHTSNISQGGICLETDTLKEAVIRYLSRGNIYLDLRLHIPQRQVIKAVAEVVWYKQIENCEKCFVIGVDFRSIVEDDIKTLLTLAPENQKNA